MKKRSVLLALLAALVLGLLIAVQAMASGAPEEPPAACRYFYQLIPKEGQPGGYDLYVERTRLEGTPLHTGSISLTTQGDLSFTPETGITTAPLDGVDIHGVLDGRGYVSFVWYYPPKTDLSGTAAGSQGVDARRQKLGTVVFTHTDVDLADVELFPWIRLPAGKTQLETWQNAQTDPDGDPDAQFKILRAIWRMEDPAQPDRGYYQGYYALGDPDTEEGGQEEEIPLPILPGDAEETASQQWVDLTAGWQGFNVGTYDPEEPISLTFYRADENGDYGTSAHGVGSVTPGTGTGYKRTKIDFSKLTLYTLDGVELATSFPDGTYKMVLKKESHVDATFTGLTVTDGMLFPELLGMMVILPCGDVDGDQQVSQKDRALLTEPDGFYQNNAKADPDGEKTLYDLDGDGNVTETDLAILIAPANYGRRELKFNFH